MNESQGGVRMSFVPTLLPDSLSLRLPLSCVLVGTTTGFEGVGGDGENIAGSPAFFFFSEILTGFRSSSEVAILSFPVRLVGLIVVGEEYW